MDNNVNNNTDNNVAVENTVPTVDTTDAAQISANPATNIIMQPVTPEPNIIGGNSANNTVSSTTQSGVVEPKPVVVSEIPVVNTTATVTPTPEAQPTVTVQPTVTNTKKSNTGMQEGYYKKFIVMMGIIVGGVLLISGILLYFLLTGSIENRNRLTCTKTIQGEGYEEHIKRYYTFDGGIMKRVYVTHTFTYDELTDDMYNQTFDKIINNDTHFDAKYGLGVTIERDGNIVKINAYNVNYLEEDNKDIAKKNKDEKFACE